VCERALARVRHERGKVFKVPAGRGEALVLAYTSEAEPRDGRRKALSRAGRSPPRPPCRRQRRKESPLLAVVKNKNLPSYPAAADDDDPHVSAISRFWSNMLKGEGATSARSATGGSIFGATPGRKRKRSRTGSSSTRVRTEHEEDAFANVGCNVFSGIRPHLRECICGRRAGSAWMDNNTHFAFWLQHPHSFPSPPPFFPPSIHPFPKRRRQKTVPKTRPIEVPACVGNTEEFCQAQSALRKAHAAPPSSYQTKCQARGGMKTA